MRVDELAIGLVYEHRYLSPAFMESLAYHGWVLGIEDGEPSALFWAQGSIRCYSNRFMCFLDTGAAWNLIEYVRFLIGSVVALAEPDLRHEFRMDFSGGEIFMERVVVASLFQDDASKIVLHDLGNCDVSLSFLAPRANVQESRHNPFFTDVIIEKRVWHAAACLAIDVYMCVAEKILVEGSSNQLGALVGRWKKHRLTLTTGLRADAVSA